jgi:hypothetical protein
MKVMIASGGRRCWEGRALKTVFRVAASFGLVLSLGGCLAAAGVAASGAIVGATSSLAKDEAHDLNRQLMRSEMEVALDLGKQRHPDVFGSMTVEDDEFYCLFRQEYPTYVGLINSRGERRAAEVAIDNAAERSREGECDAADRFLKSVNPFDLS